MWRLPFGERWLFETPELFSSPGDAPTQEESCLAEGNVAALGPTSVQLVYLLVDQLQLLQEHLQQPAVNRLEVCAGVQRIAQLCLRGTQLPIGHGRQNRWACLPLCQCLEHATRTDTQ